MISRVMLAACAVMAMVSPAPAEEAFVGRWAATPAVCASHGGDSATTAALVATATSLWWYEGYCRIGKMYKTTAVYVQADCGAKDVAVTLDAAGNKLRVAWNRGKPAELMRCK